ncbi:MAG TPA: dUTP diphosphatase [Candidatus Didemnitutus sp.]|nr:dUTP diphosphatase [Candidatus Didemnitutus sp.]
MNINLQHLPHAAGLPLPTFASEGAAGMDVCAAVSEPMVLGAGKVVLVPTGVCVAIPRGYEMQVRSRSGLAAKQGVFALNSPGTIDSDYRGEVKVILANFSNEDVIIERGTRIAQLVVARHETVTWNVVETLDDTVRGEGGFGSTGVHP